MLSTYYTYIYIYTCFNRQSEATDLDPEHWELVVKCEGDSVPVRCEWGHDGALQVAIEGKDSAVTVDTDWTLGDAMMLADINGKEVAVQVYIVKVY